MDHDGRRRFPCRRERAGHDVRREVSARTNALEAHERRERGADAERDPRSRRPRRARERFRCTSPPRLIDDTTCCVDREEERRSELSVDDVVVEVGGRGSRAAMAEKRGHDIRDWQLNRRHRHRQRVQSSHAVVAASAYMNASTIPASLPSRKPVRTGSRSAKPMLLSSPMFEVASRVGIDVLG